MLGLGGFFEISDQILVQLVDKLLPQCAHIGLGGCPNLTPGTELYFFLLFFLSSFFLDSLCYLTEKCTLLSKLNFHGMSPTIDLTAWKRILGFVKSAYVLDLSLNEHLEEEEVRKLERKLK
jgi:hypothetical protein